MTGNKQEGSGPTGAMQQNQQKDGAKVTMSSTSTNQLLRQARRTHTWSQADLAERIGVAKETISRWENGVSRPQPQQLSRLCETFGMRPDELGYTLDQVENHTSAAETPHLLSETASGEITKQPETTAGEQRTREPEAPVSERRTLTRRRLLVGGSIAVVALAGGTVVWLREANTAQSSSPRTWPTIKYDISHHSQPVRVVQYMLKAQQNYDLGPADVDGTFGPATQEAVKKFQKDHDLPDSGIVDSATWDKLIVPSDPNSRGSQVSALQECLQQQLDPKLSVDGTIGPQTIDAIHRFRQIHHLPMKNVADQDFWCLLVGGHISNISK